MTPVHDDRLDPRVCAPLLAVHALALAVPFTGVSAPALLACIGLLLLRQFGINAGYHRLLAHDSYRCGRVLRFALAWLGASAAQLGPLWWVGYHRLHHRHADTEADPHSPAARSLGWAHLGWLLCARHVRTPWEKVRDLARVPELVFLERFHWLPPLALAAGLFWLGEWLRVVAPQFGATGLQLLGWGFVMSTVLLYHLTFAVNSLGHRFGSQRFPTRDASRNLGWLAPLTLGDAWHNNHHAHPAWARHGHAPRELDLTWLALRAFERVGLVWDLRGPARPWTVTTPQRKTR